MEALQHWGNLQTPHTGQGLTQEKAMAAFGAHSHGGEQRRLLAGAQRGEDDGAVEQDGVDPCAPGTQQLCAVNQLGACRRPGRSAAVRWGTRPRAPSKREPAAQAPRLLKARERWSCLPWPAHR